MSYALLAFLLLLVAVFGFFMWKSRDTWRWYHITSASLLLIFSILFLFPTAQVLRARSAWHKVKEDLESRLEQLEREQLVLKHGDPTDPAGVGVLALQEELHRYSLEAGRRWQSLRPQAGATPNNIVLVRPPRQEELPPGMEAAEEPPAQEPVGDLPLIPQEFVVYAFAEATVQGIEFPVPNFYLGEFRVKASTPTQVTLEATAPLEGPQRQAITGGQARSWTLYELLPLDSHDIFIAPGSEPTDESIFGRVDEQLVRRLLGERATDETIQEYLRDGTRAQPDDPPPARWTLIEFTRPHSIVVDSPERRGALDGGFFDATGQAVDSRLQRPEDDAVQFRPGDQIVVKEEAATALIDAGVATLVDSYFIRPLNDYRYVLRNIRLRIQELAVRKEMLEFEQKVLEEAIAATVAMLASNQEDKLKLESDLAQMQVEREAITSYAGEVRETLASTRRLLANMYRENLQMHSELSDIHWGIEEALR